VNKKIKRNYLKESANIKKNLNMDQNDL